MEVFGEIGDEASFTAVAVEADIERLREFEAPLGKRAGVYCVKSLICIIVRVLIGTDLVVVLFVCEQRQG